MKQIIRYAVLGFIFAIGTVWAATDSSGVKTTWGYKGNIGPARWGQLNHHFVLCAAGKEQSPIDIINNNIQSVPYALTVNYHLAPLDIMRDGATMLTLGKQHTLVNTGHGVQVDFHNKDREIIHYRDQDYELIQFHFHAPSETLLRGESFPLEIHFVHQGKDGQVVVMAVFVKGGEENDAITQILDHLPAIDGKEHLILNQKIDPAQLLPSHKNYYSFMGSLTTPPCAEGLQWIVFDEPITASPAQIAAMRKAMGGGNARPVQPLHAREVGFSKQSIASRVGTYLSSWVSFFRHIDG